MPVYKITHREWAEKILLGSSIRVGTFSKYRGMERPILVDPENINSDSSGGIDDYWEGRSGLFIERLGSGSPEAEFLSQRAERHLGIKPLFSPNISSMLYMQHTIIQSLPNFYILSLTRDLETATVERLKSDSEKYCDGRPYDTAVEIKDPQRFGDAIARSLAKVHGCSEALRWVGRWVYYKDRVSNIYDDVYARPDPFTKGLHFESQKEARMVFDFILPDDHQGTDVTIPLPYGIVGNMIDLNKL